MGQGDILGIGLLLVALGGGLWLATRLILRSVPAIQQREPASTIHESGSSDQQEAFFLVETGGLVGQISPAARRFFKLEENEQPNLERLARRIRPGDQFINLCASEGHARFVLDGQVVEVSSFQVAVPPHGLTLVSLRKPDQVSSESEPAASTAESKNLQWVSEFTRVIGSSLDFDTTLLAIHVSLNRVISADLVEISLWEAESEQLAPYRIVGMAPDCSIETPVERYSLGAGLAGQIARDRKPVLVEDLAHNPELRLTGGRGAEALQVLVGVPLEVQNNLVGTMIAGSLNRDAFSKEDLSLMGMFAGPAAAALSNAMRFRNEQRRAAELSGLAQLAQGFSSARDPKSLFARLIQSIVPLIKVNILGFLIYNENTRTLEGQEPIYGLPAQFVEMYRVPVQPNSPAEQMLLNQDLIITEFAAESPEWETLGLDVLARAASLRDTVLVPLASGGRMLGYLQASNHSDGSPAFTQEEIHLLTIVANQAAPVIENVSLVMQARQRVLRAEALRRIASLASSSANLDEILKFALQELTHLLHADLAFIFLLDQSQGVLRLHQGSMSGHPQTFPGLSFALATDDPQYHFTLTGSSRTLSTRNINDEKAVIPFYHQLTQAWQVVSVVAVPLLVRDEGIGELWLCSRRDGAFDQGDVQVVATSAGQLASVVEQSYLSAQTDETLRRRVEQLTVLTQVSRELSSSRDLKTLMKAVYDESLKITGAECGTILLFAADTAVVHDFTGDPLPDQLSDLEQAALRDGETLNLSDLTRDGISSPHDEIASMLVVPIRYQSRSVGLIILHGKTAECFKNDEIEAVQSLASQAAVALSDAYLFAEHQRQEHLLTRKVHLLDELKALSLTLRSIQSQSELLENAARTIRDVTQFQVVVISLFDVRQDGFVRTAAVGLGEDAWEDLRSHVQPWQSLQPFFQDQFKHGAAYYVPAEESPSLTADLHTVKVLPDIEEEQSGENNAWDPDDMLLVPLISDANKPSGLVSLDAPLDGKKPDPAVYEALDMLAGQIGLVTANWLKVSERDSRISRIETEHLRLQQTADQARVQVPLFLQHDLEQTVAVRSLTQQMERIRAGLEIAEQATRQPDALAVLRTLARELLTRFDMQIALVAEQNPNGVHLLDVIGSVTTNTNPEVLFGQRNPLRQTLQDGSLLLVADLDENPDWRNTALLSAVGGKSFIVLPLEISEDRRGGVLVIGQRALPAFSEADHQVYAQLSKQISLGTQNLDLLSETRQRLREMDLLLEFTRKIGSLDQRGILTTLVETALAVLPNGDAGWVGLWVDEQVLIPQAARGYADNQAMLTIHYTGGSDHSQDALPIRAIRTGQPMRGDVAFAQDYNIPSNDLMQYRKATGGRLPVSALIVPIGRGSHVAGILVIDQFSSSNAFDVEDEALVVSLAQQSALALENARLFTSAEQRASQLQALNQVSAALSSSLQRGELISTLFNHLRLILPFETATLWLRQENTLSVAAADGFEDNESRLGISAAVTDSALFQEMVQTGQPLLVPDVRQDFRFPSLLVPDNLSWLGIPLIAKSELIGAIALEKLEPGFYTSEHLQSASTFASQAGVALENARLFEESNQRASELDQRTQRLVLLNRLSSELGASLDEATILQITCQQLHDALNASWVSAILTDEQGGLILAADVPADDEQIRHPLPRAALIERLHESQGIFSTIDLASESDLEPLSTEFFIPRGVQSLLFVPLVTAVDLHGWLVVQNSQPYRFPSQEIELARTMSNQAAVAMQNARLYNETRLLTRDLERRVEERTSDVRREHNNTQALLQIITELSSSLDLNLVMNRTLQIVNQTIGSEESLILLNEGSYYRAGLELSPESANGGPRKGSSQWEIARWVARRRVSALIDNIVDDSRWPVDHEHLPGFRSAIAVPLMLGEEVKGSLLILHRQPSAFMIEQVSIMEATARQFSIALNNAELFTLIHDQAEHLGGLLRDQQIEASRSRAILESVADGVVVTDSSMQITLFNDSAENILNLKSDEVVGKSLDTFIGLFGQAGLVWRETIQRWSQDPHAYQSGETYAEQIDLDNGRVVAVNMAPVFFRNQFLATVSIFRDITQEVQVDRLKSQFVANVSHELRTPMTSIKGYVEIMLMGATGPINDQQKHFLEIVKGNTERLNVLVNDLLDVSKIEAGRIELSLQPLDLREIASEVIRDVEQRGKQENKKITFNLETDREQVRVMGDAVRIRQVMTNLVTNGYNYTPDSGAVTVKIYPKEGEVIVDVKDNGIGIDPGVQDRIFERFYRGEDPLVLATAGTGLGLAISRILIEMHHGRIWFQSSGVRGEGSAFSFALPAMKDEE